MDQTTKEAGKTMAIISYVTLIGTLIAYFSNQGDKKNEFVSFHIGQAVRIWILLFVLTIVVNILVFVTSIGALGYLSYIPFVLAVLGAMNANSLKAEPVPVIGTIGG